MYRFYLVLSLFTILLTACTMGAESTPILVYLPTPTPTSTATATATPKPTLTPNPSPTIAGTATLTPEPWLEIKLKIRDAETGEAVAGDVYVLLFVDDDRITELIEEDVSETTFNLPRASTRADAIYIQVLAEGYQPRGARLPSNEAKTRPSFSIEIPLERSSR